MKKYAIIVAGGQGMRMGSTLPKQFLYLGGRPMIMHTIEVFLRYDREIKIILGLPGEYIDYWGSICDQLQFELPHRVCKGGETRFHTVKNALGLVGEDAMVAIHDGVRPFVTRSTIDRCFEAAEKFGAAIPCVEVPDSLRRIKKGGNSWADREEYRLVQTPQVFEAKLLQQAFRQDYSNQFTDDASVVESHGHPVMIVEGNRENRKITTPEDIEIAEAIFESYRQRSELF